MILDLKSRNWHFVAVAIILAVAFSQPLFAQNARVVQGLILDAQKNPVAGSTIQVKQTNISTSADVQGKFSLSVPAGRRVLVVSYVGKATEEVTLGDQNNIVVTLKDSSAELNAVVVVCYGRQRK